MALHTLNTTGSRPVYYLTQNQLQELDMAESMVNEQHPPSGYEDIFVDAVDQDCQCLICHLPLRGPFQTRCGHRYCKECLFEHIRRQRSQGQFLTCPFDRQDLDPVRDVFPDTATERKILTLAIRCPREGCEWTGELRNKEEHLTQCGTCPNNCGHSVSRETVLTHIRDECPLAVVSCPYTRVGCDTVIQRQTVEPHLQNGLNLHLNLACLKLNETIVELEETKRQLQTTRLQLDRTKEELDKTTFIWKISGFSGIFTQAIA
ncbi:TNF receptor-associated factor 4-like [Stylophora pistillata]|uniref:TNF receptor-associated factor 4-like n=1 Tax=Stylophora pistillata TaxID=50429 RepID=UPI000C055720|nr:TNF receptor-associated factor 4-like [Stylophora pistillata]